MATDPYSPGGASDSERRRLETQLYAAFGPSFSSFEYDKFISDPGYARLWYNQIAGPRESDKTAAPGRQAALQEIIDYYKKQREGGIYEQSGGKIDVESLFSPLKQNIEALAAQARQSGTADINRQSAGAERRASESLAGTGLGRSGAAAGGFASIQNQRTGAVDRLLERVSNYEMQAKLGVDQKIAEMNFSEELRKRGMNANEINSALQFNRSLYTMQFENLLQASQEEQKSFWDSWGGVIGAAVGFLGTGFNPAGASAGYSIGSGI